MLIILFMYLNFKLQILTVEDNIINIVFLDD